MSEQSKQRRDERWAARYEKSQAAFDARGRDSDLAGGWTERISGPDQVVYRICVIAPGQPDGRDWWYYARLPMVLFVPGWFPRARNEDWVVDVKPDQRGAQVTRARFKTYLQALEHVRRARLVVTTGSGTVASMATS